MQIFHLEMIMADVSGKGVPDAANGREEPFGSERMLVSLNESNSTDHEIIPTNVKSAVGGSVGVAERFDDITMFAITLK